MKLALRILVIIISVGLVSSCGEGPHPKNRSFVDVEISLRSSDNKPLANYPFRVDNVPYYNDLSATTMTDEKGTFKTKLSFNRGTTWLWEGLIPADKPASKVSLDFYLPELNQYGEYQTLIVLADYNIDEKIKNIPTSEFPRLVPAKINADKQAANDPSKFIHGAYYHAYSGVLERAVVIANSTNTRLIPMMPRGSTAFLKKVKVPINPRLQVAASKSMRTDKRGWLLKLDLVLISE